MSPRAALAVSILVACGTATPRFSTTTPPWTTAVARSEALRLAADWDGALAVVEAAMREVPDANGRMRLLVERAAIERELESYRVTDGLVAATATLADAAELAAGSTDDVRAALAEGRAWIDYSNAFDGKSTFDAARASFDQARALRELRGDVAGLAMAWFGIGLTFQQSDRLAEARDAFRQGLDLAERSDAFVAQGYLQRHLGFVESELAGDPTVAIPYYERSLELREQYGHRWGVIFAALTLAEAVSATDPQRARDLLDRAIALAAELRVHRGLASSLDALAALDHIAGDLASACDRLAGAIAAWNAYRDPSAAAEAAARHAEWQCPAP
jgi:tetratricopeptide (TPR) repeat protein